MKFRERVFWFDESPAELPDGREIVVDCFAGGGGASLGIKLATGRAPDVAINHDKAAIAMHLANHPETQHWCENLAWFSPDCTHFSKAKGGKPREKRIRSLAWIVVRWAARVAPRVICVENVEEFVDWGPLDAEGQPDKSRKGITFASWRRQLQELGYVVEWRLLLASDYGSPTTRRRLFVVARRDGEPIVWPEPSHGSPREIRRRLERGPCNLRPWRSAAEIIDWALPCPSLFLSPEQAKAAGCKRPLADKTLARIAEGIRRYVIETDNPFIVGNDGASLMSPFAFAAQHGGALRRIDDPWRTVAASHKDGHFLIVPQLMSYYGERPGQAGRGRTLDNPVPTVTSENRVALVAAFIAKHFGGQIGCGADRPFPTVTMRGTQNNLVAATLIKNTHGDKQAFDLREPLRTVLAGGTHHAVVACRLGQVRAFLWKYYGSGGQWNSLHEPAPTITVRDRLALGIVLIGGEPWQIVDIGMRMLSPRELFRAQGFPDSYLIDVGVNGRPATKGDQVGRCGNSVCPQVVAAVVRANFAAKSVADKLELHRCEV
jgi:DNA (cytosine-5)-methyltransferase 1